MIYKRCADCGDTFLFTRFYLSAVCHLGLLSRCKSCHNKRTSSNPNRNKNHANWRAKNVKLLQRWQREYRKRNKEGVAKNARVYEKYRWHNDPVYKIGKTLRTRLGEAIKQTNSGTTKALKLLGESVPSFINRISQQLKPGWTWENWGAVWELDHKRPCASFDLTDPAQQAICFHFSNFQPLSKFDNRSKGAKLSWEKK